jgi:quinol monooxygenase YgiN
MKKIVLKGHIKVPADDLPAVQAELPAHITQTRAEAGCLAFEVKQRAQDPQVFDVWERFESKQAFDQHQARVRASRWGAITGNVSRHYEISEEGG